MSNSHVVSGLLERRAEMAGLARHYQSEITKILDDLDHLDATIRIFAPEMDIRSLRPKAFRRKNAYFKRGEGPRLVLDVYRDNEGTLNPRQVLEIIARRKGWDLNDAKFAGAEKAVEMVIFRLHKSGVLKKSA